MTFIRTIFDVLRYPHYEIKKTLPVCTVLRTTVTRVTVSYGDYVQAYFCIMFAINRGRQAILFIIHSRRSDIARSWHPHHPTKPSVCRVDVLIIPLTEHLKSWPHHPTELGVSSLKLSLPMFVLCCFAF